MDTDAYALSINDVEVEVEVKDNYMCHHGADSNNHLPEFNDYYRFLRHL